MRGSVENGERGDIRYRDMQNVFSVQGDTLVIPLQSNFQVERTRNGVVCLGRLIPHEKPGVGHPYFRRERVFAMKTLCSLDENGGPPILPQREIECFQNDKLRKLSVTEPSALQENGT